MSQLVAIIDYGSGNLRSAEKAFVRAASDAGIEATIEVTSDPDRVAIADRIMLPGVGAFADCRSGVLAIDGLYEALVEQVITKARPFLGVCVGMQLMANRGLEKGTTEGFGWIDGDVMRIEPSDKDLPVPHMGWNTLSLRQEHPLFSGIETGDDGLHAYFVHSFHMQLTNTDQLVAITEYGGSITATVGRDNMLGTQFHPEKSQKLGLALIANFLRWAP